MIPALRMGGSTSDIKGKKDNIEAAKMGWKTEKKEKKINK